MKLYMAPMEGITDWIYRNTYEKYYGGIDKYYTPFLSPNQNRSFTTREKNEIDPAKCRVPVLVPQLLTNNAEHFVWAAGEIAGRGFKEVNLNLGCPSGTVTSKKKGSGFLAVPDELDTFFEKLFEGLRLSGNDIEVSVKTRVGVKDPAEFERILSVFNRYPIAELIIHPRVREDFYTGGIRYETFGFAADNSRIMPVYNGEIRTAADAGAVMDRFPKVAALMLGRGLLTHPELAAEIKSIREASGNGMTDESEHAQKKDNQGALYKAIAHAEWQMQKNKNLLESQNHKCFSSFHDELLEAYTELLPGEIPLLHRMKEFWALWGLRFDGSGSEQKALKTIRKSKSASEYKAAVQLLLG